jgi:hypothetical protein
MCEHECEDEGCNEFEEDGRQQLICPCLSLIAFTDTVPYIIH